MNIDMLTFLKYYLVAFGAFFVLDLFWLGWLGRDIYRRYLGHLMRDPVDWSAAIPFYLIFLAGLVYFAVLPSANEPAYMALLRGAAFGLVTYATYELTNRAVLANWPWPIVFIDILWGIVLSAAVSWASWRFGR
jgi:uncharacterized membrane protein